MELSIDNLVRFDWVESRSPGVRMKFRRDGSGYYERDGVPGARVIRDNLLFRIEAGTLHLKFAHARLWTEVHAESAGAQPAQERIGEYVLTLDHDPYAQALEERTTPALVLLSDPGAALPE